MRCLCHNCSPDYQFNPAECMFCHNGIKGEGKFKSPNGARVCQSCMKDAAKVLEKAIEEEAKTNEYFNHNSSKLLSWAYAWFIPYQTNVQRCY